MSQSQTNNTSHGTFVIERTYPSPRESVFAAWAEKEAKEQWFGPGEAHELDFRIGGRERLVVPMNEHTYRFESTYQDIVAGERIIYSYEMYLDDRRMSVSLAAVELATVPDGTHLTLTEYGVFLDGLDTVQAREHGTIELMEKLAEALAGVAQRA